MSILDAPTPVARSGAPIWKTVFRYGLLCSAIMILSAQISYRLGYMPVTLADNLFYMSIALVAAIVTAALAIGKQRNFDGGYIPFGKGWIVGLLAICLGFFILSIWNWIFARFIDPEYIPRLKQLTQDYWRDKIPGEGLEQAVRSIDGLRDLSFVLVDSAKLFAPIALLAATVAAAFMTRKGPG